jgi:hypothetical protein
VLKSISEFAVAGKDKIESKVEGMGEFTGVGEFEGVGASKCTGKDTVTSEGKGKGSVTGKI